MNTLVPTPTAIAEYSDEKRLAIYKMLTSACTHLYSKGKLQEDKFNSISSIFSDLAINDPIFMAHLAAYSAKKDSKDMRVLTVFFNALNDANGTPFFKGSSKCKPNYRNISYAILQDLDPHLALRVLELCHKKFSVKNLLNEARHFPTGMKTAFKKYIGFRENNPDMLRGIKRAGLTKKMQQIYRLTRTAPTELSASILAWKQGSKKKGNKQNNTVESLPDFSEKSSVEIADILLKTRLSPTVALSIIPSEKITAKVAEALMKNCTGNQTIILYNWFSKNGFLDVKAIKSLFKDKVKQSTTAIDRIDTLTKEADEEDKKEMANVRSEKRKATANTKSIGKIFLHIDASSSMSSAIQFAKDKASIIAECVENPKQNFRWGLFGSRAQMLNVPNGFTKEDFYQALYGVNANMGSTDCIALYSESRKFGADVDIYITDQGHNVGTIHTRIAKYHTDNPSISKPKAAVIVDFSNNRNAQYLCALEDSLKKCEIPVVIIKPEALNESALVAQSVKNAMVGEMAVIEEILDTPLPTLPTWWNEKLV